MVERSKGQLIQPLKVTLDYPYARGISGLVKVEGLEPKPLDLSLGRHSVDFSVPTAETERAVRISIEHAGKPVVEQAVTLKPVRKMLIYILPHSHVDIGYTALQADVVKKQNENIDIALRLIEATRSYPEGARFKWNGTQPKSIWLSDTSEKAIKRVNGPIEVPGWGLVTVRVEF